MKKKLLILCTLLCTSIVAVGVSAANVDKGTLSFKNAGTNYSLVFNSEKNKFHNTSGSSLESGNYLATSENGGKVNFAYNNIIGGGSNTWNVLGNSNSYFCNTDPINGITNAEFKFNTNGKTFKLYWSYTASFNDTYVESFTSSTSETINFNFNGTNPKYFKFENTSDSNINISEILLNYNCDSAVPILNALSESITKGTVIANNGPTNVGTLVNLEAVANIGYQFDGWFENNSLVSKKAIYQFEMPNRQVNFVAKFSVVSNSVNINNDNDKGTVTGGGIYQYGSEVTLKVVPNNGYTFNGWKIDDSIVCSDLIYSFIMPDDDLEITTDYSVNTYTVSFMLDGSTYTQINIKGTLSGSGTYEYGSSVTVVATPKAGYVFTGWFKGNSGVSLNTIYTFTMPAQNLTLNATFDKGSYDLVVESENESFGMVSGGGHYVYQTVHKITATPKEGYDFYGWYKNDNLVSMDNPYSVKISSKDETYVAKFTKTYSIFLFSENDAQGTVDGDIECGAGLKATVNAHPVGDYQFSYWHNGDFNQLSTSAEYTFTMPAENITLYAVFSLKPMLTVFSNDLSLGTATGNGRYTIGETVTLTASPELKTDIPSAMCNFKFKNLQPYLLDQQAVLNLQSVSTVEANLYLIVDGAEIAKINISNKFSYTISGSGLKKVNIAAVDLSSINVPYNLSYGYHNISSYVDLSVKLKGSSGITPYTFRVFYFNGENKNTSTLISTAKFYSEQIFIDDEFLDKNESERNVLIELNENCKTRETTLYDIIVNCDAAPPVYKSNFINWTLNGEVIGTSLTLKFVMPDKDCTIIANFEEL